MTVDTVCPLREFLASLLLWGSHVHSVTYRCYGPKGLQLAEVSQRKDMEAANYLILSLFISIPTTMGQALGTS